jgi:ribonuclease HI
MPYYAVARGYNPGIYFSWDECKKEVTNFSGAIYKKFASEVDAEDYILNCNNTSANIYESVYNKFDDNDVNYFVYTDGSCYNNGKIDSVSGIGIFFGVDDNRNVSKLVETTNYKHTNNNAELVAILECYKIIKVDLDKGIKVCIVSDSEYSIKGATSYGEKCEKCEWSKNIPNKELVKELYDIYKENMNLKLKHIKAHTNKDDIHSIGNRNADKLAYAVLKNNN